MNPTRHTALAHLSSPSVRPNGQRITPLYDDPARAAQFSATPTDLTLDYAKSSIRDAARDARFSPADAADLHDASNVTLIAQRDKPRGEA